MSAVVHSGFTLFINDGASKQRPNPSQFLPAVFESVSYSLFRLNPSHHFLSRTGAHHREPLIWWERQIKWAGGEEVTSGEPLKEDGSVEGENPSRLTQCAGFSGFWVRVPQQPDPPAMETAVRWNTSPSHLPPHALASNTMRNIQRPPQKYMNYAA